MTQYIPKSALVAEIEKAIKSIYAGREYVGIPYDEECIVRGLQKAEDIINTLEVKEVDLNKEIIISEDLEETIKTIKLLTSNTALLTFEYGFRKGAKWQKERDQETIELAEDHAMFAGMEKMKDEMMTKAIDAQCFGFQGAALFSFKLPADNYLVGSEVKVIVVKEN